MAFSWDDVMPDREEIQEEEETDDIDIVSPFIDVAGKYYSLLTSRKTPPPGSIIPGSSSLESMFYGAQGNIHSVQPSFFSQSTLGTTNQPSPDWMHQNSTSSTLFMPSRKIQTEIRKALPLDERDAWCLSFIARYAYVTPLHLAILTSQSVLVIVERMHLLAMAGYISINEDLGGIIYLAEQPTMKLLGLEGIKKKTPRDTFFKHDYMVGIIAAELESGRYQLPGETLQYNRKPVVLADETLLPIAGTLWGSPALDSDLGDKRPGERLISERVMRSGWAKLRDGGSSLDALRRKTEQLTSWHENGEQGLSPELKQGGEGLLFVADSLGSKEHAPDLVVKRPRVNGQPQSICVEFERTMKKPAEMSSVEYYERLGRNILSCNTYSKLIYFTPSTSIANTLHEAFTNIEKTPSSLAGKAHERFYVVRVSASLGGDFTRFIS